MIKAGEGFAHVHALAVSNANQKNHGNPVQSVLTVCACAWPYVVSIAQVSVGPPVHQAVAPLAGFNAVLGGPLCPVAVHIRDDPAHLVDVILIILVPLLLQEYDNDAP